MRLYAFGPRFFGLRLGVSFNLSRLFQRRRQMPSAITINGQPFVYVIKDETGRCKIGSSGNPLRRLTELQTASASPLSLAYVGVPESDDGGKIERGAHAIAGHYRASGEWFVCPAEAAIAAVHVAAANAGEKLCQFTPAMIDETVQRTGKPESMIGRFIVVLAVLLVIYFAARY